MAQPKTKPDDIARAAAYARSAALSLERAATLPEGEKREWRVADARLQLSAASALLTPPAIADRNWL